MRPRPLLVGPTSPPRVFAAAPGIPASTCTTIADPVWEFDQEAFDLEWGAASFPLDQYVGFAYAESAVPEPAELALFTLGALILGGVRVLRRRG